MYTQSYFPVDTLVIHDYQHVLPTFPNGMIRFTLINMHEFMNSVLKNVTDMITLAISLKFLQVLKLGNPNISVSFSHYVIDISLHFILLNKMNFLLCWQDIYLANQA